MIVVSCLVLYGGWLLRGSYHGNVFIIHSWVHRITTNIGLHNIYENVWEQLRNPPTKVNEI